MRVRRGLTVRKARRRRSSQAGFTLVEILVVITIIGLIMALVGPRVLNYLGESKAKAAKIQIESFSSALDLYYLDLGRFPTPTKASRRSRAATTRPAGTDPICVAAWCPTIPGAAATSIVRRASAHPTKSFPLAPTVRKAAVEQQPISPAARAETCHGERGFALIEILCVLAIIGMLAAIILPAVPRSTTRAKLESYAVATAALLKSDRSAALRRQIQVTTEVDAAARSIRSGVTGRVIRMPDDVSLDAILASRCADRNAGRSIDFFPSGMSCGGVIALSRPGMGVEVRVNWLTGGVDIVPQKLL
jgi:general secretion pathway protein H